MDELPSGRVPILRKQRTSTWDLAMRDRSDLEDQLKRLRNRCANLESALESKLSGEFAVPQAPSNDSLGKFTSEPEAENTDWYQQQASQDVLEREHRHELEAEFQGRVDALRAEHLQFEAQSCRFKQELAEHKERLAETTMQYSRTRGQLDEAHESMQTQSLALERQLQDRQDDDAER